MPVRVVTPVDYILHYARASRAYGTAQPDASYPQLFELLSETDRGPRLQNALQVLPIFERCAEFCGIV